MEKEFGFGRLPVGGNPGGGEIEERTRGREDAAKGVHEEEEEVYYCPICGDVLEEWSPDEFYCYNCDEVFLYEEVMEEW